MKMIFVRKVNEEAPVNNVGGGNIAGVGVGPKGEPGVKKSKYKRRNEKTAMFRRPAMEMKRGKFAGMDTFIVPNNIFERARLQKRKGGHWTKYLDEDAYGNAIREYANKNPYKPIIFEDENTGCMVYARYGGEHERTRRIMKEDDDISRLLQYDAEIQKMSKTKPEFPSLQDTLGKQQGQYDALPAGQVAKGIDPNAGKTPNYDPQGTPSPSTPGFYSGRVMTGPEPMPQPPSRALREEDEEILLEAKKKVSEMTPEEHGAHLERKAAGRQWHVDNPVHMDNIVKAYHNSTADERHQGDHWYKDAQHVVRGVAKDAGVPHHTMAGLVSVYSPQTLWHTNIITAAGVARRKRPVGGPGSGVYASKDQKGRARRMLKGEHHSDVLVGHKTRAFAHLLEHGGSQHENNQSHPDFKHHVVIDRHAHSVASGSRITEAAFDESGLDGKKKYNKVAQAYVDAAAHLSKHYKRTIHPHQVQATTWLRQQRVNSQSSARGGTSKAAHTAKAAWDKYASRHHPHLVGKEPGIGYTQE